MPGSGLRFWKTGAGQSALVVEGVLEESKDDDVFDSLDLLDSLDALDSLVVPFEVAELPERP